MASSIHQNLLMRVLPNAYKRNFLQELRKLFKMAVLLRDSSLSPSSRVLFPSPGWLLWPFQPISWRYFLALFTLFNPTSFLRACLLVCSLPPLDFKCVDKRDCFLLLWYPQHLTHSLPRSRQAVLESFQAKVLHWSSAIFSIRLRRPSKHI